MNYFDDEKNVQEYIKLAEGFDGRELVEKLKNYLPVESTLLEIGMGPGKDLDLLSQFYKATGSDLSKIFVSRYKALHPQSDVIELGAVSLDTKRKFQGLYSNKVLHHLAKADLKTSFLNQLSVLETNGIALHSFWFGSKEEYFDGLRFVYYTVQDLLELLPKKFHVLDSYLYEEMEPNDSICLILKKSEE